MISPIGILESTAVSQLPFAVPSLFSYAKLTEAQGEYAFKLDIVRRNDMVTVAEAPTPKVTVEDPMENVEIVMDLGGLVFNTAGYYDLRIWANDRFLDSNSLRVDLIKSSAGG